jgi:hypothetical protein
MSLKEIIKATIARNKGVLFARPAIVCRKVFHIGSIFDYQSFCGRSLIAPNGAFEEGIMDDRGYVPVEW